MEKQLLYVYAKLESFTSAKNAVQEKLRDLSCLANIEVKDYSREIQQRGGDTPITVAMVIDKRQTRCLITPSRRDKNVDHWDELRTVSRETRPLGSILVIIYGDDEETDQLVGEKWKQIWRYNDETANELALRGRIYTIKDDFNEKQKEALSNYFSVVSKLPSLSKSLKIYVYGDKDGKSIESYFGNHPFLVLIASIHKKKKLQLKYKILFNEEKEAVIVKFRLKDKNNNGAIKGCGGTNGRSKMFRHLLGKKHKKKKRGVFFCLCPECCKKLENERGTHKSVPWSMYPVYSSKACADGTEITEERSREYQEDLWVFCYSGDSSMMLK